MRCYHVELKLLCLKKMAVIVFGSLKAIVKPRYTDTTLSRTLLCPWGEKAPTDTPLIRTLSMAPSVSIVTRFDHICYFWLLQFLFVRL